MAQDHGPEHLPNLQLPSISLPTAFPSIALPTSILQSLFPGGATTSESGSTVTSIGVLPTSISTSAVTSVTGGNMGTGTVATSMVKSGTVSMTGGSTNATSVPTPASSKSDDRMLDSFSFALYGSLLVSIFVGC